MFIGAGPASTGGGIKVTTFALLAFVIWSEVRGEPDVVLFGRRIPDAAQRQALSVALVGVGHRGGGTFGMLLLSDLPLRAALRGRSPPSAPWGSRRASPPSCPRRPGRPGPADVPRAGRAHHRSAPPSSCGSGGGCSATRRRGRSLADSASWPRRSPASAPAPRSPPASDRRSCVIGLGRFGTALAEELESSATRCWASTPTRPGAGATPPAHPRGPGRHHRRGRARAARRRRLHDGRRRHRQRHRGEHPHHGRAGRPRHPNIWAKAITPPTAASSSGSAPTTSCSPSTRWASGSPTS